jgi:rare lipoprotein A
MASMLIVCALAASITSCAGTKYEKPVLLEYQRGTSSWYGEWHRGRKTANGEIFNPDKLSAAHRKLRLGTIVKVTNLKNGKTIVVRINDRGPYVGKRILDLSREAARRLDFEHQGLATVRIEIVDKQSREKV